MMLFPVSSLFVNSYLLIDFGHTEQFKVYDIADGKVADAKVVDTNGNGHGALAGMLSSLWEKCSFT